VIFLLHLQHKSKNKKMYTYIITSAILLALFLSISYIFKISFVKNWIHMVWLSIVISTTISTIVTLKQYKSFKTEIVHDTLFLTTLKSPNYSSYKVNDTIFENGKYWYSCHWIDFPGNTSSIIYDSLNAVDVFINYNKHIEYEFTKDKQLKLFCKDDSYTYISEQSELQISKETIPYVIYFKERYIPNNWTTWIALPYKQTWKILVIPENYLTKENFINYFQKEKT